MISRIVAEAGSPVAAAPQPSGDTDGALRLSGQGMVLEDSLIIAMDAAASLEDLGASKVEIISSVPEALRWLDQNRIDFAILDVNLGEEQSLPVARRLHEIGVPFVLATGYGSAEELVSTYPPCTIVQKPFTSTSLEDALRKAMTTA